MSQFYFANLVDELHRLQVPGYERLIIYNILRPSKNIELKKDLYTWLTYQEAGDFEVVVYFVHSESGELISWRIFDAHNNPTNLDCVRMKLNIRPRQIKRINKMLSKTRYKLK